MKASKKTIILLFLAVIVTVGSYTYGPEPMQPGMYHAELVIDTGEQIITHSMNVTIISAGEDHYKIETFAVGEYNFSIQYKDEVLLKIGSKVSFKIITNGLTVAHQDIHINFIGENYNGTLRPTKISGDIIYIEFQPLIMSKEAMALLGLVALLWFTEGIPLVATALMIPTFLILLDVYSPTQALAPFFDPVVALILGGFLIGRALTKYELDKRIALELIVKSKGSGNTLILVLMLVSAFLSFWISNTATAAIMIPIGLAMIGRIRSLDIRKRYEKVTVLAIAYSATLGGIGTVIGSPPNALAVAYLNSFLGADLSFTSWLTFGLPVVVITLPIIWRFLIFMFKPPSEAKEVAELRKTALEELEKLGELTGTQKAVIGIFAMTIVLWLTQKLPDFLVAIIGWPGHGISSSTISILAGFLLLALGFLDEKDISRKISWSALLILGSGILLGSALVNTGISYWLGVQMSGLHGVSPIIVNVVIGFLAVIITMFASNTAAAAILIPIGIPMAISLDMDPMLITMTIAIGASLDFALPTGTPPSTIAYSTGKISLKEMIKTGIGLDIIALLVLTLVVMWIWVLLGLVVI